MQSCPYCIDELSCTEHELAQFVTGDEQCFETHSEPEPEPEPKPKPFNMLLILPIIILLLIFILSRR